ncbi:MAG: hypothetical protein HYY01_10085 [Chloroflexi bacterium]|nr:hypothetical protein [Chloroflexota bacterium]
MDKKAVRRMQKAAARRKATHRASQATPAASSTLRVLESAPVLDCMVPSNLFDVGLGHVVVAREVAPGKIALAAFLLDVFCLGVLGPTIRPPGVTPL